MRQIHSLPIGIVFLLVPLLAQGDEQSPPPPEKLTEVLRTGHLVARQCIY
jgi:hypothetical protein